MAKPTYYEQLRDPRWQRKRLEVMQRDGFSCQECGSKDKTLNVHHRYYRKDHAPWDYEDKVYVTLCEGCHTTFTRELTILKELCGDLSPWCLRQLQGFALGLIVNEVDGLACLRNADGFYGFSLCCGITPMFEPKLRELMTKHGFISKEHLEKLEEEIEAYHSSIPQ